MIHGVHKPDAVILRKNIDHGSVYVKRHFILENVVQLSLFILKDRFRSLIRHFDAAAVGRKRIFSFAPVKYHHIAGSYHVHKDRFHICHIELEGTSVHAGDLLLHAPSFWFLKLMKIAHQPHSVIFYDHALRLMKNIHGDKPLRGKILLLFDDLHRRVAHLQHTCVILLLSFLAENEKSLSIYIKVILLQGKIQERSLSAFQEPCNQINRNRNFVHVTSFLPDVYWAYRYTLGCYLLLRSRTALPAFLH